MKAIMIKKDRAQLRQKVVDTWFQAFVDAELYDKTQYHDFCRRVKDMNEFQISRLYRLEKTC